MSDNRVLEVSKMVTLTDNDKESLSEVAKSIRSLSIDAIEAANSGHPGLPLGCAEIMAYLYGVALRHNPENPQWIDRDRFVLSAGHGSMALYSALFLAGFDVSLDDVKAFRQLGSKTPGHPEYGMTAGVETTTGPLGQGLATATGLALGHKMMASQFGLGDAGLANGKVFVLAGDGDLMEGVTSEAGSFAGHLNLDNLIVFYDANDICLDGPIDECFTEDVGARYRAYGWDVTTIDGHSFDAIHEAVEAAKTGAKPSLIIAKTVIGKGAPSVQGTSEVHGKALGQDEAKRTKEFHGIPTDQPFYVSETAITFMKNKKNDGVQEESKWKLAFSEWAHSNKENARALQNALEKQLPVDLNDHLKAAETKPNGATRQASNGVQQTLKSLLPNLVVGSADLSCSDNTILKNEGVISASDFSGRNIKYGVREFAMAAISTGLALHGCWVPVCGTFLVFSDYMRNAIRLSSLMKQQVIFHFTHDSIFLGEDGPTHQPVEHLASLRAMPGLTVIRPADATETKAAWAQAVSHKSGPTALILTRLAAPDLVETQYESVQKGAYIAREASNPAELDYVFLATGSELKLALDTAAELEKEAKSVRVVSLPSFELFDQQDSSYRNTVLGEQVGAYWTFEAQVSFGWDKYTRGKGHHISVETFGESAPSGDIATHFGFTVDKVLERIKNTTSEDI